MSIKNKTGIIMGVDPGLHYTGVGVITWDSGGPKHLLHDVITVNSKESIPQRLLSISQRLTTLIDQVNPAILSVEKAFFGKNADSAFKLGLVRGVVMLAGAKESMTVMEFATRSVKKGVTGHGDASKETVALFVQQTLKIKLDQRFDASDALALALFAGQAYDREALLTARGIQV